MGATKKVTNGDSKSAAGLFPALAAIRAAITGVGKDKRNEFHKYDYASAEGVARAVKPLLDKHGVLILPSVQSYEQADAGIMVLTMLYRLVHAPSGEQAECTWLGVGQDKGDKAAYKAYTGALKYFLIDLFQIPTSDDPEGDSETDRRAAGNGHTRAKAGSTKKPAAATPRQQLEGATEKQIKRIMQLVDSKVLADTELAARRAAATIMEMVEEGMSSAKAGSLVRRLGALPDSVVETDGDRFADAEASGNPFEDE